MDLHLVPYADAALDLGRRDDVDRLTGDDPGGVCDRFNHANDLVLFASAGLRDMERPLDRRPDRIRDAGQHFFQDQGVR